jgi:glycosyltransferase involved in cell wall biosynthesis
MPTQTKSPKSLASPRLPGTNHSNQSIVALGVHESRTENFISEFQRRDYRIHRFSGKSPLSYPNDIIAYVKGCLNSDLVLAGTRFPWLPFWILLARLLGRTVLLDFPMDLTIWPFPQVWHWRWMVKLSLRISSCVVTLRSRSYLAAKFGIEPKRILFIESCPDVERIQRGSKALARFVKPVGRFVICCSGGETHHRLERFLPIFEILLGLLPNALLLVIAEPSKPIFRLTKDWAAEKGCSHNVLLLPLIKPVEDFYATVSCCDLWVATMGDDTLQGSHEFRMELLEMAVLAKPVVSAATAGLLSHELVDGANIIYINPLRSLESAEKIALWAKDRGALQKLGQNLSELVRKDFGLSSAVDQFLNCARPNAPLNKDGVVISLSRP